MTGERRAQIIAHIQDIARKPWRGEAPADQRAELDGFKAALRQRGEANDADVIRAFAAAERQLT